MAIPVEDDLTTRAYEITSQDADMDTVIQIITQSKLDADQYMAVDLDGATESLAGSGNLSYAVLQASQTDEAIRDMSANSIGASSTLEGLPSNLQMGLSAGTPLIGNGDDYFNANALNPIINGLGQQSTDRGMINDSGTGFSGAGFSATTIGSVGASQLSSDVGNFSNSTSGLSLGSGLDGNNGVNAVTQNGTNGNNGTNGSDGTNGNPGTGGNGDTNIDIDVINLGDNLIDIDLGDAGDIINNVLINLNETVTNVTDFLSEVINVLGDIITSIDLTNIVDLDFLTEIVTNITDNLTTIVNNVITNITEITTSLTNIINNLLGGGGFDGLHLTLDLNVLDTLGAGVDIPLYDILATDLNLDISLTPTLNLLENIGELTGLDLISSTLDQLGNTTGQLQNTIDGITDIVTNLNLKDLGATLEDAQAALGNLDDLVSAALGDVTDLVSGALEELGLGGSPLDTIIDTVTDTVLDPVVTGLGDVLEGNIPDVLQDGLGDIVDETLAGALDLVDQLGLGDMGLGLGESDPDGLVSQTLDPVVGDIGNILDDITGGSTNDLTDTLDNTIDQVTDFIDVLTGGLTDGLAGLNNNNQGGTDSDLAVDLGLGAPGAELLDETLEIALDPVEDLLGDIDLGVDLGLDLLGQDNDNIDNNAGDSDITLHTGIDLVDNSLLAEAISDIPLDPLENILGDIDLDIGASVNLLGDIADPFVNSGEGGTGEQTFLAGLGETLGDITSGLLEGDLDPAADILGNITDNLDTLLANAPALGGLNDIMDSILNGAGDTDFGLQSGLDDALGLLDNVLGSDSAFGNLVEGLLGGNNDSESFGNTFDNWTESILPESGGLFDDLTGALGGGHDVLPDPVGTIAEGLGALDIMPQINIGKLGGGLFG